MQWILLIGDSNFNLKKIETIFHFGSIDSYEVKELNGRYCVDFGDNHIFYDIDDNISDYTEDISIVPFDNPNIIIMAFTSEKLAKRVLMQENFPKDIYVDNNYGLIVSINDFISLGMPMSEKEMKEIDS